MLQCNAIGRQTSKHRFLRHGFTQPHSQGQLAGKASAALHRIGLRKGKRLLQRFWHRNAEALGGKQNTRDGNLLIIVQLSFPGAIFRTVVGQGRGDVHDTVVAKPRLKCACAKNGFTASVPTESQDEPA